jgi:hypothetical protein
MPHADAASRPTMRTGDRRTVPLPNLLIIGAPKAGTTSLHAYIAQHPEISMSEPKELRYFWRDDWREQLDWYAGHFDADKPVRGESTPAYTMWPHRDHVPERASELIPDARLIYMVRDPIDRLASHWRQRIADGFSEPFEYYMSSLERADNPLVCASRYATQIERWLQHYDRSRILVIDQQRLRDARGEVVREVFSFLGLGVPKDRLDLEPELNTQADKYAMRPWAARLWDKVLWPASRRLPETLKVRVRDPMNHALFRPVTERAEIDEALRSRLEIYFQPEVDRLRELTGEPFESWSV